MPLLERDGPLASLADTWAEAQRGHGLFVLLAGEAGVGKTSLVREFARRLGDARVVTGACDAMSTPRPLGPLMDVAAELGGDVSRAFEGSADPAAAFAALLAELGARPTVFIIEDAHWADAATIDLLRFLSRRIGTRRALLVVTCRDDELGPQQPLRVLLGDLAGSAEVRRIALRPLSQAAVQTLAAGTGVDAAALFERTGGNPFFVIELLHSPGSALPETVRDAVLARAARLGEAARSALDLAAVIGASAELSVMGEVLGQSQRSSRASNRGSCAGRARASASATISRDRRSSRPFPPTGCANGTPGSWGRCEGSQPAIWRRSRTMQPGPATPWQYRESAGEPHLVRRHSARARPR